MSSSLTFTSRATTAGVVLVALLSGCESRLSRRPRAAEPTATAADAESVTAAEYAAEPSRPARQPDAGDAAAVTEAKVAAEPSRPDTGDAASSSPLVGHYRCTRVLHPVVDFHGGYVELREDGRFRLQHVNTAPEGGYSIRMEGPWHIEGQTLVFVPEYGVRRTWRGDEHRHRHGEDVPYTSRQETLYQTPRRVPITTDASGRSSFRIPELNATFYRLVDAQRPPPCADERPRPF